MSYMKRIEVSQIVEGTRSNPGKVVKSFPSTAEYKCGGHNTACLRAWSRIAYTRGKRNSFVGFFTTITVG
jgi:hypothetical protein